MDITKEEFEEKFKEDQELLLKAMADDSEVNVDKFFSMACFLENLVFFSPVIYSLLKKKEDK